MRVRYKQTKLIYLFITAMCWCDLNGQEIVWTDSIASDSMQLAVIASPVTVHAPIASIPYTISTIDQTRIHQCPEPIITPLLNATPGLWMQSGALNTNRISIRGVGYREPFATTGIKIYLDEIPLTNGVGESSIEDIHPNILSGIDIWRGPASALWGSGLGGMINLKSQVPETNYGETKIQVGSYERLQVDQHLSVRYGKNDAWGTALHYQFLNDEGYRDNNQYQKNSFTWIQHWKGSKGLSIKGIVHAIALKAFIPSSLNLEDYENNPSAAAPTWDAVMGNEDYSKWITGINLIYAPERGLVYKGSFFGTFFDSDEVRPFNVLQEHNTSAGMRHRVTFKIKEAGHVTAGIEYFNEQYAFSTYETLEGGNTGPQLTDDMETRSYLNAFLQTEWTFGSAWYLFGGLNMAISQLSNEEIEADTPVDFFPSVGASFSFSKTLALAASVSRGYSSLSLDDILDSDGVLNTEIVPETGWSEEISVKYNANKGSYAKLTFFSMNIKNTVLTRRIMDDVFEKLNGGSSLHQGIELEYKWANHKEWISIQGAYTYGDYSFSEFMEGGSDFSGNQLPGNPLHRLFTRMNISPWRKWDIYLEHHWIDDVYLNDANTVTGGGYQLLNAGLSYDVLTGNRWNGTISTGVHNLFDTHYSPMFQINAPGTQPRYYYPGKPLSVYLNIILRYKI